MTILSLLRNWLKVSYQPTLQISHSNNEQIADLNAPHSESSPVKLDLQPAPNDII